MMKKGILIIGTMLVILFLLSGCIENETSNITDFEKIDTDNFILYDIHDKNQNEILDIIQDEYELGNELLGSIEPDVSIGGRSHAMLLFKKG